MDTVIDFKEYIKNYNDNDEFQKEIEKSIELFPLNLTQDEKNKVINFGIELWEKFCDLDKDKEIILGIGFEMTAKQKAVLNKELQKCFDSFIIPRNKFIQYLIARLIFQKIKYIDCTRERI